MNLKKGERTAMLNFRYLLICSASNEHSFPWTKITSRVNQRRAIGMLGMVILAVLLLIIGCLGAESTIYRPDVHVKPRITAAEARQIISGKMQSAHNSCWSGVRYQNVQATMKGFSFFNPGGVPAFGAKAIPPQTHYVEYQNIKNVEVDYWPNWHNVHTVLLTDSGDGSRILWCGSRSDVIAFADAVNAMRYYSSGMVMADDTDDFAEFQEKAKAWRALAIKPSLPEQARRFKVQAEDAFQHKDFEKAAEYYENALETAPFWPDGYFNAALLYGELGFYSKAVLNMKRYLELRPDAEDSQAARDRVYIWEGKIVNPQQPLPPKSIRSKQRK
jgi:hypothetical protein